MKSFRSKAPVEWQQPLFLKHTPSFTAKSAYFYVQSIGRFLSEENYYTHREGYKSYLLLYTISGKGYANYRGKHYELYKDHILLIDCYDEQEYYTDKTDLWEIEWLHFYGCGSEGYFKTIYENYGPVVHIKGGGSVFASLEALLHLKKSEDMQFDIKASCVILQMLTDILLNAEKNPHSGGEKTLNQQIENAVDYLETNYSGSLSLEDIARAACLSPYHFIRVFKKFTGYSPYEYLIKYRISKAKTLLASSSISIDEIARRVGFESTSNFIKTFRGVEDVTPLKYRKYWHG